MKNYMFILMAFCSIGTMISQDYTGLVENPLTSKSYALKVNEDLNLLITGDKNLKEGLSYTYNKSSEEITLSGPIADFKNFGILTLDGKFTSDEGSIVFNNNDKGAKQVGVTLNYFFTTGKGNYSKYGVINKSTFESNRTLLALDYNLKYTNSEEKLKDSLAAYLTLAKIFNISTDLEEVEVNKKVFMREAKDGIEYYKKNSVSDEIIHDLLKKYYPVKEKLKELKDETAYQLVKLREVPAQLGKYEERKYINKKKKIITVGFIYEGFKMQEFLKDLKKLKTRIKNYSQVLYESEKVLADDLWTSHSLLFFGMHSTYKRESIDVFNFDENFSSFSDDLFETERGDIFEVGLSANYFITSKKKNLFAFAKALLTLSNSSNIAAFSKNTYEFSKPVNDTLSSTDIVYKKFSKTGYVNKNGRAYSDKGYASGSGIELYGGHKRIGLFTRIEFKESKVDNEFYAKKMPWRAGFYVNFTSKEKDLVSLLLFTERTNLFLHPSEDFNIGFKIGLPLNLNKAI